MNSILCLHNSPFDKNDKNNALAEFLSKPKIDLMKISSGLLPMTLLKPSCVPIPDYSKSIFRFIS